MNIMRKKLADLLRNAAYTGIKKINPECECAKALNAVNVEAVLKEDIDRICNEISIAEIMRFLGLAARLKNAPAEEKAQIKNEIKKVSEDAVARIEKKSGRLKIPDECRFLLLNL